MEELSHYLPFPLLASICLLRRSYESLPTRECVGSDDEGSGLAVAGAATASQANNNVYPDSSVRPAGAARVTPTSSNTDK